MKYLFSVAVALSAIVGSLAAAPPTAPTGPVPPSPYPCNTVTPVKGDVWEMGKPQTVTWDCKTGGPLEKQPPQFVMHTDLGTGSPTSFVYVDTIDEGAKVLDAKFTWNLLTKYTPGDNYILRVRSKKKGDPNPVTDEETNKLQWGYSPNFKIVAAGGAANTPPGQVTTGNNTTANSTSPTSSTGGSSTGGSSTGGSSTGGSSTSGNSTTSGSANNSTKPPAGNGKSTAGIVSVNIGVFFTTVLATLMAAAFL